MMLLLVIAGERGKCSLPRGDLAFENQLHWNISYTLHHWVRRALNAFK
jgi:hypothetical protein